MSRLSRPNTSLAEARPFQGMSLVNQHAAGVDIGAHEMGVFHLSRNTFKKPTAIGDRRFGCVQHLAWQPMGVKKGIALR